VDLILTLRRKMTRNEISRRFPKASEAFIRANLDKSEAQSAVVEPIVRDEPLATPKGKAGDTGRVSVRVVSVRNRLIDPDNLCPKYFIDCLRYAKLLRDDTAAEIELTTSQRKPEKGEAEQTLIFIDKLLT
jgi:hypothetical protein